MANEVHPMALGPWRLELPVDVDSDILSGHELSFWVTLGKVLHLYVIVREKECWLFVLDAKRCRRVEEDTMFAGRDHQRTDSGNQTGYPGGVSLARRRLESSGV